MQINSAESYGLFSQPRIKNWLNLRFSEIEGLCEWNEKNPIDHAIVDRYVKNYKNFLVANLTLSVSNNYSYFHAYNSELIDSMKDFMRAIQNCLTGEDRLTFDEEFSIIGEYLKIHSQRVFEREFF